ncbi:MAG: DUF1492 domain-containing protein [Lachnospiraceae bacterium]|nr:DUF1492 domain-containing protein [Lachnospiraceae bacterium]
MTDNQARASSYLSSIRNIEKRLNNKRLELEALRYKASGAGAIRYDKDRVQSTPEDFLVKAMGDIIQIEKQIEKEEREVEKKKGRAYSIVRKMDKAEHRIIIEWYYFNGLSMIDAATRMNIAERTAYYLRDDALEGFGKLM